MDWSLESLHHHVRLLGIAVYLLGVRLTLRLGGFVVIGAGLLASAAMRMRSTSAPPSVPVPVLVSAG